MEIEASVATTTTTSTTMKLSGRSILMLINQQRIEDGEATIPPYAEITFEIPGGGDWSNESYDFRDEQRVKISWTVTEEKED